MKLSKSDTETYHRVLVSGLSGSGKSTLISDLANEFDIIWLDLENGKDVLTKLPEEALSRIEYIKIPDSASFPVAALTLMSLFKSGKANICEAHGKADCALCKKDSAPIVSIDINNLPVSTILVVDSITQLASSIFSYTTKDKPVEYKPERDDWGALRKYSEFFASQFQAFSGNLVCSCHAVEAELEDGKTKLVPSFGSKDMSSKIAKAFSDVVYCDIRNKKHVAISGSTSSPLVLTKSRSDFLIESLQAPSLIPLFKNSHEGVSAIATKPASSSIQSVSPAQQAVANLAKTIPTFKKA
jgi:hypothetical protein